MNLDDLPVTEMTRGEMRDHEGGNLLWELAKAVGSALLAGALEELEQMSRPTV